MSQRNFTPTGITLPTVKYINSISEEFPNSNRTYKVESAISNRFQRDHIPINGNLSNQNITDSYVEFILPSNGNNFISTDSFYLESSIRIVKNEDTALDKDCNVTLIDGFAHRMLLRSSLFLNGIPIENNGFYGIYNAVRYYLTSPRVHLPSSGRNSLYKDIDSTIHESSITKNDFDSSKISPLENKLIKECKGPINFITPLNLDISSANFYLLNNIDIRLRFDLSPSSLLINTCDTEQYKYKIDYMKLWCEKIVPYPSSLLSLNKSLNSGNVIDYIFNRPIIKTFVYPTGHSSLSLDNIFNGVVPHIIYIFFMAQKNLSGSYASNGAYFTNAAIENIRLEINGNTFSSMNASFPNKIAHMFNHTLNNIKGENHLLSLQSFRDGRTIQVYDLRNSDCEDVISIEKTGNIRVNIQSAKPLTENLMTFVVGETSALIEVDGQRRVKTSYLM